MQHERRSGGRRERDRRILPGPLAAADRLDVLVAEGLAVALSTYSRACSFDHGTP